MKIESETGTMNLFFFPHGSARVAQLRGGGKEGDCVPSCKAEEERTGGEGPVM